MKDFALITLLLLAVSHSNTNEVECERKGYDDYRFYMEGVGLAKTCFILTATTIDLPELTISSAVFIFNLNHLRLDIAKV